MKNGLIIFDVDGTLVNSAAGTVLALKETIQEVYHLELEDKDILEVYHHHFKSIISHFHKVHDELKLEKAKQLYVKKSLLYSHKRALYPNVKETLTELSQHFYIATATNLSTIHLKNMCDYFEITKLIDHVRGTDTHDSPKPNPQLLNESIEMFNVDREQSYMVGDSLNDIRAGQSALVKTIAVCYPGNDPGYYTKVNPDFIARNFNDIKRIVHHEMN